MIGVIDYGAGNLRNVCKSLEFVGAQLVLSDDRATLDRCDKIVLPGVGAFADCAQGLRSRGLWDWCIETAHTGKPFLGICVGMQLLFESGHEMGDWPGLGLLQGRVAKFGEDGRRKTGDGIQNSEIRSQNAAASAVSGSRHPALSTQHFQLKIPHIGWNQIALKQPQHPLLAGVQNSGYAYFVHSFHAAGMRDEDVLATCDYGYDFPAVVGRSKILGIQFHPEKSQDVGLQMLRNFASLSA
jgi:glutamine amidotransferase